MISPLSNTGKPVLSGHPQKVLGGKMLQYTSEKKESVVKPWVILKQQKNFRIIC